jgi:hypothetical protein
MIARAGLSAVVREKIKQAAKIAAADIRRDMGNIISSLNRRWPESALAASAL